MAAKDYINPHGFDIPEAPRKPYKAAVHAAHCCWMHGCKYGDDDCPVQDGKTRQLYPCEQCQDDIESDLPGLLNDMYNAGVRRGLIMAGVHEGNLESMKMKGVR